MESLNAFNSREKDAMLAAIRAASIKLLETLKVENTGGSYVHAKEILAISNGHLADVWKTCLAPITVAKCSESGIQSQPLDFSMSALTSAEERPEISVNEVVVVVDVNKCKCNHCSFEHYLGICPDCSSLLDINSNSGNETPCTRCSSVFVINKLG